MQARLVKSHILFYCDLCGERVKVNEEHLTTGFKDETTGKTKVKRYCSACVDLNLFEQTGNIKFLR